jgi:hypothetical protein
LLAFDSELSKNILEINDLPLLAIAKPAEGPFGRIHLPSLKLRRGGQDWQRRDPAELATEEHSRRRQGSGGPGFLQKKQRISLPYAFVAFLGGKGLFLAGMREFRAATTLFLFFNGIIP